MKHLIVIIACFVAFSMNSQVDRVLVNGNEIHTTLNLLELESVIETLQAEVAALQALFSGCMDETAANYNPAAVIEDGSCAYGPAECGGASTVTYDGYTYDLEAIGDQCWFAENCRYLPTVSPTSESSTTSPYYYVYGYEGTDVTAAQATTNYDTYGVLYNWPAVMTEGICPSGWHIPSDAEFTQLTDFLGGAGVAGGKMKEAGTDHWYSPNTGATNSSGFTGLPGGYYYSGGFYSSGDLGYWWSSSESGSSAWVRVLDGSSDNVVGDNDDRNNGFSARCVRD